MKVTVTQEHIDQGVKYNRQFCPIACALREQTKAEVSVGSFWANLYLDDRKETYRLPPVAEDFVFLYDSGANVEPFEFEMEMKI